MKRTHHSILTVLTLAAILGLTASAAYAKDEDNNPPGPVGGKGTNWENPAGPAGGPGASPDVAKPGKRAGYDDWLKNNPAADLNKDGKVDKAEQKRGRKEYSKIRFNQWLEHHPNALERFDTNKDGQLDKEERKVAHKEWKEHTPQQVPDAPVDKKSAAAPEINPVN